MRKVILMILTIFDRCAKLLSVAALAAVTFPAFAADKAEICAKYRSNFKWSKGYAVTAAIASASEMAQHDRSVDYNYANKYVVIFWSQDEATVIEMDGPFFGPTVFASKGTDKTGKLWEISASSGMCF